MANYPGPGAGNSQAYTCVAWKHGAPQDTLIGRAADHEQILIANFDLDAIRAFRKEEGLACRLSPESHTKCQIFLRAGATCHGLHNGPFMKQNAWEAFSPPVPQLVKLIGGY